MLRAARDIAWVWALGAIGPATLLVFSLHFFAHTSRPLEDPLEYRPIYSAPNDEFISRLPGRDADFVPVIDEMTRIYAPHKTDLSALCDSLGDRERIVRTISKPYSEEFQVSLRSPRKVTFHRFFWPAWHLYLDDRSSTVGDPSSTGGREIISRPDSIGRAASILPKGEYTLRWQLEKMPLELSGLWISGISWGMALIALGAAIINGHGKRDELISANE